jgi:hypothetical protein
MYEIMLKILGGCEMKKKKKKIWIIVIVVVLLLAMCGRGGSSTKTEEVKTNDNETVVETTASLAESESDTELDICYADLLPVTKDYFKNGEVMDIVPDGGEQYVFRITGYQDGEYEAYVEACKDLGFDDVTYEGENQGGKMFFANSNDGKYYLEVMLGYQIEAIDVTCKLNTKDNSETESTTEEEPTEEETTEVVTEATTEETTSQADASGIRPEFKAAMDSYEKFFDEYCAFMKKYKESNDASSMLADYTKYMAQYADTMAKLDAIDEKELSTEEAVYYAEVSARITSKLAEVAQ